MGRRRTPKLEQYAKALERKRAKARAYIESLQEAGYTVSEGIIRSAYEKTPERITKRTLDRLIKNPNLDLRRIGGEATKQTKSKTARFNLKNPWQNNAPIAGGQVTKKVTGSFIVDLNKNLRSKHIQEINTALWEYLRSYYGKLPAQGTDINTPDLKLDKGWKIGDLSRYVTIKPTADFSNPYIEKLLTIPSTTTFGQKTYEDDWRHRSYLSNVKNNKTLGNISAKVRDRLEKIMNDSSAWKASGAYEEDFDSNQVKENWEKIYKAVKKTDQKDSKNFDRIVNAIENESDTIILDDGTEVDFMTYVEDVIKGAKYTKQ